MAESVQQHSRLDKPARLSFSCSLDLLLNDIDQTNINRDIRDGNWLSTPDMDLRRVITSFVSECNFFATDNSRKDLHFNSLGAPKMHYYGLHSAKYGFIFLATAQAPHRRICFVFCQKSNLCLICLQIISPLPVYLGPGVNINMLWFCTCYNPSTWYQCRSQANRPCTVANLLVTYAKNMLCYK